MEREIYSACLDEGVSLQYKGLSLNNLQPLNITNVSSLHRRYQVHQEGKYSQLFNSKEQAIDKFIELKGKS